MLLQSPVWQSESRVHCWNTSQGPQSSPPQSTSVSSKLMMLSPQCKSNVVGVGVGIAVGSAVGAVDGGVVGVLVGAVVGSAVGAIVGLDVRAPVGAFVGAVVGAVVGDDDGGVDGTDVGSGVGSCVTQFVVSRSHVPSPRSQTLLHSNWFVSPWCANRSQYDLGGESHHSFGTSPVK